MALKRPIVIIGAGLGGLSAAVHLAAKKHQVVIYEKNNTVGGKMAEIHQEGFRWDIGPSFITMLDVFEDLFRSVGKSLEDYIQFIPVNPFYKLFFSNGKELEIYRDLSRTVENISAIEPRDVEGYLSFLAYAARQYRLTGPIYTYNPAPLWQNIFRLGLRNLSKIELFKDFSTTVDEHLISPEMRQFLAHFATSTGTDPFNTTALQSANAHIELTQGVWYPRGGVFGIASALKRLAIELGVKIHVNAEVQEIVVQDKSVVGLILGDGSAVETDLIVSNVDAASTYRNLLPKKPPYIWAMENVTKLPMSFSAFILLLGVKDQFRKLNHHNIFFSEDYRGEFRQISQGKLPDDPTIKIAITSKADTQHAPRGCENWFVMVNVPPNQPSIDWDIQASKFRSVVLNKLHKFGINLEDKISTEIVLTPNDLESMTGAYRGALYGPSMNDWMAPFRRQRQHPKTPDGLYFVGSTTNPGGTAPLVLLSGKYAASKVNDRIA